MIQVMKQWLILISIDMWQYHKSTFLCTHQRLKISMWKLKMSSVFLLVVNGEIYKDPNKARRDFVFFFQIYGPPLTTEVLSHIQLGLISWAY